MVRILKKQLKSVISMVAGEDAVPLAMFLKNKQDVSEFEIAESIGTGINTARSMLYKLHQENLVFSTRRIDEEKGWYIYYWSFRPEMIPKLSRQIKFSKLKELKDKLHKETNCVRFLCSNECVVLEFDHATNFDFRCPECGTVMNYKTNSEKYVNSLKIKIRTLEKEII